MISIIVTNDSGVIVTYISGIRARHVSVVIATHVYGAIDIDTIVLASKWKI